VQCRKCQEHNKRGSKFCKKCGEALQWSGWDGCLPAVISFLILITFWIWMFEKTKTLSRSAFLGKTKEVENFISKGADINTIDKNEDLPLVSAIYGNRIEIVKLLVSKGADVNARFRGTTPLHCAVSLVTAYYPKDTRELAEFLIKNGADVNARDSQGATPLHYTWYNGQRDIAELLISSGAKVNSSDNRGWTALHKAAFKGNKELVALLIAHGADINAMNKSGNTPLKLALKEGHRDIERMLRQGKEK